MPSKLDILRPYVIGKFDEFSSPVTEAWRQEVTQPTTPTELASTSNGAATGFQVLGKSGAKYVPPGKITKIKRVTAWAYFKASKKEAQRVALVWTGGIESTKFIENVGASGTTAKWWTGSSELSEAALKEHFASVFESGTWEVEIIQLSGTAEYGPIYVEIEYEYEEAIIVHTFSPAPELPQTGAFGQRFVFHLLPFALLLSGRVTKVFALAKKLSGVLSLGGSVAKVFSISKKLVGQLPLTGVSARTVLRPLEFGISMTGHAGRLIARGLNASVSMMGSLSKSIKFGVSGSLSQKGSLTRFGYTLTAVLSMTGSLRRTVTRQFNTALLTFSTKLNDYIIYPLLSQLPLVGNLKKTFSIRKLLEAVLPSAGSLSKSIFAKLNGSMSLTGVAGRLIRSQRNASLPLIGSLKFAIQQILNGVLEASGVTGRKIKAALKGSLSFSIEFVLKPSNFIKVLEAKLKFLNGEEIPIPREIPFLIEDTYFKWKAIIQRPASLPLEGRVGKIFNIKKIITAQLPLAGRVGKNILRSLTGSLSLLGHLVPIPVKTLFASLALEGKAGRTIRHQMEGLVYFSIRLRENVVYPLMAKLNLEGTLRKAFSISKRLEAVLPLIGNVGKTTRRTVEGTLSLAVSTVRTISHQLGASLSFRGGLQFSKTVVIEAFLNLAGTVRKQFSITKRLEASISSAFALPRHITHALVGKLEQSGSTGRIVVRALSALIQSTGALSRKVFHPLSAELPSLGVLARRAIRSLGGSLGVQGVSARRIVRQIIASVPLTGSVARTVRRLLEGSLGLSGALMRSTKRSLQAMLPFSTNLFDHIVYPLFASLAFEGRLGKNVKKRLEGLLSFTGGIHRGFFVQVLRATLGLTGGFLQRTFRQVFKASLGFFGKLPIQREYPELRAFFVRLYYGPDQLIHRIVPASITMLGANTYEDDLTSPMSTIDQMRNQTVLISYDLDTGKRKVSKSFYEQPDTDE